MVDRKNIEEGIKNWHPGVREYWFSADDVELTPEELKLGLFDKDDKIRALAVRKILAQNVSWESVVLENGANLSVEEKRQIMSGISLYFDSYFKDLPAVDSKKNVKDLRQFIVYFELDGLDIESSDVADFASSFDKTGRSWASRYKPVLDFPEKFKRLNNDQVKYAIVSNFKENGIDVVEFLLETSYSNRLMWDLFEALKEGKRMLSQQEFDMLFERMLSPEFVEPEKSLSTLFSSFTTNNAYIKKEFVEACVSHPSSGVRSLMGMRRAWRGVSPTLEQVNALIHDTDDNVKSSFVSKNSWGYIKPTNEMVSKGLQENDKKVRKAWISKTSLVISDENFEVALKDKSPLVRHAALNNKDFKLTPARIFRLLQDPSPGVRESLWAKDWGDVKKTQDLVDNEFASRFHELSGQALKQVNLCEVLKIENSDQNLTLFLKEAIRDLAQSEKFRNPNSLVLENNNEDNYERSLDENFVRVFEKQGLRPSAKLMDSLFSNISLGDVEYYHYHSLKSFGLSPEIAENLFQKFFNKDSHDDIQRNEWDVLSLLNTYRPQSSPEDVMFLIERAPFTSYQLCSSENFKVTPELAVCGLTYLSHGYKEYDSFGGKYWVEGLEIDDIRDRVLFWVDKCLDPIAGRESLILQNSNVRKSLIEMGETIKTKYEGADWTIADSSWVNKFTHAKFLVLGEKNIQTLISQFEKEVLEGSVKNVFDNKKICNAL